MDICSAVQPMGFNLNFLSELSWAVTMVTVTEVKKNTFNRYLYFETTNNGMGVYFQVPSV